MAWATPQSAANAPNCPGYHYMEGVGHVCPQPNGALEVYSPDGTTSLGYIRHVDPIPSEPDPVSVNSGSAVECVPNTAGTYYIHVIYARAHNDADGYATWAPTIRSMIASANQLVDDATVATGGTGAGLKVYCTGGVIVVENESLPTSKASASFSTIVTDLRNKGYNDGKKKYWVFYDDTGACSCGGTGHWYDDDSNSASNLNNGNGVSMFAVNFGYNSVRIMLHELGHNIGAVQDSAPRSTLGGHCYDGRDTMCYNDGAANGSLYSTSYCSVEVWDCGRNDYFHANPAAGSYLATRWNIGASYNRYIVFGEVNLAPSMTSLTCSPMNGVLGDTVGCSFTATDTRDNLAYNVAWGDGTTERVPATGYLASGTSRSSSHVYATDGTFTVSVSATDDNSTGARTGAALTRSISVQAAPVMRSLSCTPNPAEVSRSVTCSFHATDNSTGVYYMVDWGDGTPTTRVPSSGTVAPGTTRTATHSWSSAGTFTVSVNATDNGNPVLSSTPRTTSVSIGPNAAPEMDLLTCTPNPVQADNPTTCSFRATDGAGGLYYMVNWGDGSAPVRVPSSGTVSPGTTRTASKTYGAAGNFTVSVTATDDGSPALTSPAATIVVEATFANIPPVMVQLSCEDGSVHVGITCTLRATDTDSTGVRYSIDWGDGSSTVFPAGYATPGTNVVAGHTYTTVGSYLVKVYATDNGSPPRTSATLTTVTNIGADITPPTLTLQEPRPGRAYYGCGVWQPTLASQDALFVARGCVKATASDPSGVANVQVLLNGRLVGSATTAPYTFDFPVGTNIGLDSTLTVTATDNAGNVRVVTLRVDAL